MADQDATPQANPAHIEAAAQEELKRQAINYVMLRDGINYPDAAAKVGDNAEAILAEREAGNAEQHEASQHEKALRESFAKPRGVVNFLIALDARVSALEAPKVEAKPVEEPVPAQLPPATSSVQ